VLICRESGKVPVEQFNPQGASGRDLPDRPSTLIPVRDPEQEALMVEIDSFKNAFQTGCATPQYVRCGNGAFLDKRSQLEETLLGFLLGWAFGRSSSDHARYDEGGSVATGGENQDGNQRR